MIPRVSGGSATGPRQSSKRVSLADSKTDAVSGGGDRRRSTRSSVTSERVLESAGLLAYTAAPAKERASVPPSSPKFLDLSHRVPFPRPAAAAAAAAPVPLVRRDGVLGAARALAARFSCDGHQVNLLQFWFVDVLADCLWRAQDEFRFDEGRQKVLLDWVVFVFELIADPQLDLDRRAISEIVLEALKIAEDVVWSGGRDVPPPEAIFSVRRPEDVELASVHSVQTYYSSTSSEASAEDASEGSYIGAADGRLYRLPASAAGGPDLDDDCLSSSESTLLEEEEESSKPSESSIESGQLPTVNPSYDDVDFYKPDMRTPPRFKEIKSEESFSIEISSESVSKDSSSEHSANLPENKRWFEIPRNTVKAKCSEEKVDDYSVAPKNVDVNENEELDEKEILKAFYDYNFFHQKMECMADENKGWVSSSENMHSDKEMRKKKAEFRAELAKYVEGAKEQYESLNQQIFVNYCMLLAIKQFILDYFLGSFTFSLVRMAYRYPHYYLCQNINCDWEIPKQFKREFKKPVPKKQKKPKKEKPKKEKKEKKPKEKTGKKEKSDKSSKKSKESKGKESKAEKAKNKKELKEEKEREKLQQKQQKEEEQRLHREEKEKEDQARREEENKLYMFPLEDAVEDSFFEGIFEDWKPPKRGKGKEKAGKEKTDKDKAPEKESKKKEKPDKKSKKK